MKYQQQTFDFNVMSQDEIIATLAANNIVLTAEEALAIQNDMLKRPPTLTEIVLWSIQCSEHCSYKSSRKHLSKFTTQGPDVILGAKEDAGIITVATDNNGKRYGLAISHESHNHPSQIVPFEGAATGVGGNIRDVCCMGARVIALADSLRFGDINEHKTQRIHEGVVAGIASYGNATGIPNLAGDVYYHPGYNDNCLVTVVTLGIVAEDDIIHSYAPKDAAGFNLILVGKATDNSGFAGASFASTQLNEDSKEQNRGAVQEPNAFLERHLLKANYALFDLLKEKNLINQFGFKDLGAGGIACASVELAETGGYGAIIDAEAIPTSMDDLHPSVILCSETQERFMWVAPPEWTDFILEHYNQTFELPKIAVNAGATVVGTITAAKNYVVKYKNTDLVHACAKDVTQGFLYDRPYNKIEPKPIVIPTNDDLLQLLADENIASREPIFEKYDKQVQGRTVLERGKGAAGVLQPFNSDEFPAEIKTTGVALSTAQNPYICAADPYWGAVDATVSAIYKVLAVGATPKAISDCLCFGNPENPAQMTEFVAAIDGIVDVCKATNIPVVAGNVSFYNESQTGAIPPSPIISCVGTMPDATKAITNSFQQPNSMLVVIGNELSPNISPIIKAMKACSKYILSSAVGTIATTLAQMSFENNIGCHIPQELPAANKGIILEINPQNLKKLQQHNIDCIVIGNTIDKPQLMINNTNLPIAQAKLVWQNGLRNKLL